MMLQEKTTESILGHLSDLKNNRDEVLAPYEEFTLGGKSYYFTPGGFLYRKDPGSEELRAFCAATSPMRSGTTGSMTASCIVKPSLYHDRQESFM